MMAVWRRKSPSRRSSPSCPRLPRHSSRSLVVSHRWRTPLSRPNGTMWPRTSLPWSALSSVRCDASSACWQAGDDPARRCPGRADGALRAPSGSGSGGGSLARSLEPGGGNRFLLAKLAPCPRAVTARHEPVTRLAGKSLEDVRSPAEQPEAVAGARLGPSDRSSSIRICPSKDKDRPARRSRSGVVARYRPSGRAG